MQTEFDTYGYDIDSGTQVTSANLYLDDEVAYHFFFIITPNEYRIESTITVDVIYAVLEEITGTWSGIYWDEE